MERQDLKWNTNTLSEFNSLNYDQILDTSHIQSDEQYVKFDQEFVHGFIAKKNHKGCSVSTLYFVPTIFASKMPIIIKNTSEVRNQSKVFKMVTEADSIKIIPQNILSFRQIIDHSGLSSHSNHTHYTLYKILVIVARISKVYWRVITKSAFGKDKYIEMVNLLINSTSILTDPTVAKLFYRMRNKFVVISEMPSKTTGEEHLTFCNSLMRIGDDTKYLENRARSCQGTAEELYIGDVSVCFIHNVKSYYEELGKKCFEEIFPKNVLNRYIPFEFYGYCMPDLSTIYNWTEKAKEFEPEYKEWIKSLLWYEEKKNTILNKYDVDFNCFVFKRSEQRYKDNFTELARWISHYAKNKVEYDQLLQELYDCYTKTKPVKQEVIEEWIQ